MLKKRAIRHNALYSVFGCLLPFFSAVSVWIASHLHSSPFYTWICPGFGDFLDDYIGTRFTGKYYCDKFCNSLPTPTTTKLTTTSQATSTEPTSTTTVLTTTSQALSTETSSKTTETTTLSPSPPSTNSTVATSSTTSLKTSTTTTVPTSLDNTTYATTTGPHECRKYRLGRFGVYYVCFKDGTVHRKLFNSSEDCVQRCNRTTTTTSPLPSDTTTYTTARTTTTGQESNSTVTNSATSTSSETSVSASTEKPKRTTKAGQGLCIPVKLRYGTTKLKGFACRHYAIAIVSESEEICEINCLVIRIVQSMSTARVTTSAPTTTAPSSTTGSPRRTRVTKRPHKPRKGECCPKEIMRICILGNNKKMCRKILKKCACFN